MVEGAEELRGRGRKSSTIADHREDKLFNPGPSLDIRLRHGSGHGGGVAVVSVMFCGQALVLFSLFGLSRELLVQLPQLDLEFFERLSMDFILRVAFEVAAPAVVVLPEDVFRGAHQRKYSRSFHMRK